MEKRNLMVRLKIWAWVGPKFIHFCLFRVTWLSKSALKSIQKFQNHMACHCAKPNWAAACGVVFRVPVLLKIRHKGGARGASSSWKIPSCRLSPDPSEPLPSRRGGNPPGRPPRRRILFLKRARGRDRAISHIDRSIKREQSSVFCL